jgi:hypothetical protein
MRRLSFVAIATAGTTIRSANAGTTNSYANMIGCSMATPHVSGVAATVMEHYPELHNLRHLIRAQLDGDGAPAQQRRHASAQHGDSEHDPQHVRPGTSLALRRALGAPEPRRPDDALGVAHDHARQVGLPRHRGSTRRVPPGHRTHMGRAGGERGRVGGGRLRPRSLDRPRAVLHPRLQGVVRQMGVAVVVGERGRARAVGHAESGRLRRTSTSGQGPWGLDA